MSNYKQWKDIMWKWLLVIILILVVLAGIHYRAELQSLYQQQFESPPVLAETALEHAEKHLDPNYVCPMHPQIVKNEPGSCPICGMDLVLQEPTSENKEQKNEITVHIEPAVQQKIGVKTEKVKRGDLDQTVRTVGYVEYNEESIAHIHLRTEGWVEQVYVKAVGDSVQKGQLLAEIYSPEIIRAQQDYVRVLQKDGPALSKAAERNLLALGMSQRQLNYLRKTRKVSQTLKIYSPQEGVVEHMLLRDGMYVTPDDDLISLVNLDTVWIQTNVFERQASWIKTGQPMVAYLNAYPGREWLGKVDYIYPALDPVTRSLKVRLKVPNKTRRLKKSMYAEVTIYVETLSNVLIVPRNAVIRDGQQERVVLALGNGNFKAQTIKTSAEIDDYLVVESGLRAGAEVVTSAHFLIDSEASLKASFSRMSQ
jgi:Cu(I)/Ag(I) efflux system membrane fusion protein